jgi:transcriptional regulator with XRE-family HTH domain
VDDSRIGTALRAVRHRKGWRQQDVAARAGVSPATVSNLESGRISRVQLDTLRRVAAALDIRVDVIARWRGGELDRLLNHRHATLASAVTEWLRSMGWDVAPEVSFAIGAERGWVDLLAWHAATRTVLVIEIKTELVDVHELLGVVDRKTRLAPRIALQRGWNAVNVATWVVMAEGSTNRRRVVRFGALLRAALPADTRTMERWLRAPVGRLAALTFFSNFTARNARHETVSRRRVHVAK